MQMTVGRLIEELKACPEDAVVYFFCDYTRYETTLHKPIDTTFYADHGYVDINLIP